MDELKTILTKNFNTIPGVLIGKQEKNGSENSGLQNGLIGIGISSKLVSEMNKFHYKTSISIMTLTRF